MILDKLLIENVSVVGDRLLYKAGLNDKPKNISEMYRFLQVAKASIESQEFEGVLLGNILFSFVSSKEVRDRSVTSRTFEDIFSGLFGEKCTDVDKRINPPTTLKILELDKLCYNEEWKISSDLSGNKREKSDLTIGSYSISLKTLKGQAYNLNDEVIGKENTKFNSEINVGSLSYRALLKGILSDNELKTLKDRKGGLGSKSQMMKFVLNPINDSNMLNVFKDRLSLFLNYIYDDDLYIVLKSNYRIIFYLIPRDTFINSLINMLEKDYERFAEIFYRWENNNLRLNWVKMLRAINEFKLPYYSVSIFLKNSVCDLQFKRFKEYLSKEIREYINEPELFIKGKLNL